MQATIETIETVTRELVNRGYTATMEYPGYISITKYNIRFSFGTASGETWDGDVEAHETSGVVATGVRANETDAVRIADAIAVAVESCKPENSALHLKATAELRRVLDNTDLAYDDEGDVLHVVTDTPIETLATLREMVDVETL